MELTTQHEINTLVSGFCQAVKQFGKKAVSLKLGELLSADKSITLKDIEKKIDKEVLAAFNLSSITKNKRNRGIHLEANICKIVLLHEHCEYNHTEISHIMDENVGGISRKINAYYRAINNQQSQNDIQKVFTVTFLHRLGEINERITIFKHSK